MFITAFIISCCNYFDASVVILETTVKLARWANRHRYVLRDLRWYIRYYNNTYRDISVLGLSFAQVSSVANTINTVGESPQY